METFKDLKPGDSIYKIKLTNYRVEKNNGVDNCTEQIVKNVKVLTGFTLDVTLDNQEVFFPHMSKGVHTMICKRDNINMQTIYALTKKDALEEAENYIKKELDKNREEQNKLKNDELKLIYTITDLLEESAKVKENHVSVEEFATMAL